MIKAPALTLPPNGCLRPLTAGDITQAYIDGLNSPEVNRFLEGPSREMQTRKSVERFVELNQQAPDGILFGLFVDDVHRGNLRLHDITKRTAHLGIALFDVTIWGKGWASRAIGAVTDYAFRDFGLECVSAGVAYQNKASEAAFAKAGFVRASEVDKASEFPSSAEGQMWLRIASMNRPTDIP